MFQEISSCSAIIAQIFTFLGTVRDINVARLVSRKWNDTCCDTAAPWIVLSMIRWSELAPHNRARRRSGAYWKKYYFDRLQRSSWDSEKRTRHMNTLIARYQRFPHPQYMHALGKLVKRELYKPDTNFFSAFLQSLKKEEQVAVQSIHNQICVTKMIREPPVLYTTSKHRKQSGHKGSATQSYTLTTVAYVYCTNGDIVKLHYDFEKTHAQNSRYQKQEFTFERNAELFFYATRRMCTEMKQQLETQSVLPSDDNNNDNDGEEQTISVSLQPYNGEDSDDDQRIEHFGSDSDNTSDSDRDLTPSNSSHKKPSSHNDENEEDDEDDVQRVVLMSYDGYGNDEQYSTSDPMRDLKIGQQELLWLRSQVIGTDKHRTQRCKLGSDLMTIHLFYHYLLVRMAGDAGFVF